MDSALLAFVLSACFSFVFYIIIVSVLRKKDAEKYRGDKPQGPVSIG